MPDEGYYEKLPRPESVKYFISRVQGHTKVRNIEQLDTQLFKITKTNGKKLVVHLTNIYIVGEAEVYEILSENKDTTINAIVTISMWNQVSSAGKITAKQHAIGVFVMSDFLGALNFDGNSFINYISPTEREAQKSRFR